MNKLGKEVLQESVGKKVLWVGEDPDESSDLVVVFDDFTAFSVCGQDLTAIEKGVDAVKGILTQKIKSAESILKLKDELKAFEEKTNGAKPSEPASPATAGA